jgi:2-polyprenyl-3-methyl-5-hydroxy-6-metoxy-1,4-benzoquinol methylase
MDNVGVGKFVRSNERKRMKQRVKNNRTGEIKIENISDKWEITWDTQAEHWEKISLDDNSYWNKKAQSVSDLISKYVKISKQKKEFLDIGCATGKLLQIMHNKGFSIRGIDISPKIVSYAKKRLNAISNVNERIKVVQGNKIPFENNSFDVITILGTLPYTANYQDYINTIYNLLNASGIVLAESVNRFSIRNLISCIVVCFRLSQCERLVTLKNLLKTGYWSAGAAYEPNANQAYSASALDKMFTNCGFELIDELNIFNLKIDLLDNNCTERGKIMKILARHLAWTHIGVYKKIKLKNGK